MSQIQTNSTLKKIAMIALVQLVAFSVAYADGNCAMRSDVREDMKKVAAKLAQHYGTDNSNGIVNVAYTPGQVDIMDGAMHKIDRSGGGFMGQLNAVGVVSEKKRDELTHYGGATLISPCHVIVSRHVVKDWANSGVYVHLGQGSCQSNQEFLKQDIPGKVLMMGADDSASSDWAIVKIKRINDIKPFPLSKYGLTSINKMMTVGFPASEVTKDIDQFRYARSTFMTPEFVTASGQVKMSDTTIYPGRSGQPAFVLGKEPGTHAPQLRLGAINVGSGYYVQTEAILRQMNEVDSQKAAEVVKAMDTGICE